MRRTFARRGVWAAALSATLTVGCANPNGRPIATKIAHIPPPPAKSGVATEAIWRQMESNSEASDFILHEHDFEAMDSVRLNDAGRDHLKNIALRLLAGAPYPVVVERSKWSYDPEVGEGDFNYPIHNDPELDNRRRRAIAEVLAKMGVPHADQRVLVGYPYTPHTQGYQAIQNYGLFQQPPSNLLNRGFGPAGFGAFGFGRLFF